MRKGLLYTVSAAVIGGICLVGVVRHHIKSIFCSKSSDKKIDFVVKHMGRKLDMNDHQKDEFKDILRKSQIGMNELKADHKNLKSSFKTDFISSDFDAGKYGEKINEHILKNGSGIFTETVNGLHGILSEEQRIKLISLMEKKHAHHGHHFCHKG